MNESELVERAKELPIPQRLILATGAHLTGHVAVAAAIVERVHDEMRMREICGIVTGGRKQ